MTTVTSTGSGRAFSLSLADVVRLSGSERAFPNTASRGGAGGSYWWLRTRGEGGAFPNPVWMIRDTGTFAGMFTSPGPTSNSGVRPALIIQQPSN